MINKVILMGRLGKDPVIKRLNGGRIVANVTLATNEVYQNAGVLKEITEWHQLEMWDKQAEFAEKYLKKGRVIYVDGKTGPAGNMMNSPWEQLLSPNPL